MVKVNLPNKDLFDEMIDSNGSCRPNYKTYNDWLESVEDKFFDEKRRKAELLFHRVGITFNVYGNNEGTERLIPFDPIPRIISADDWKIIDAGIKQRVTALNMFLYDVYHEGHILKSGIVPLDLIYNNSQYQIIMKDLDLYGRVRWYDSLDKQ